MSFSFGNLNSPPQINENIKLPYQAWESPAPSKQLHQCPVSLS